jgi:AraC-like DNA-binding protein
MNQSLLNKFQDYVINDYSNCELSLKTICSNICCSKSTLQRIFANHYDYSIMKYVEYFRILKAIELTYYHKEKKVCYKVGYKHHSSFCRSFFKVTQLNVSYFSPDKFVENKKVVREVRKLAKVNPKEAIELIIEDFSKRYTLKNSE